VTTFSLKVDGQPLDDAVMAQLQSMEAEEHLRMADILRLVFNTDVNEEGSGWRILDDDVFPPLANLQLQITVGNNDPVTVIDAYVVETQTALTNNPGESTLTVLAMDASVLLSRREVVRSWAGMADSDIAGAIFNEYGFSADVEATDVTYEEDNTLIVQRGTDMQFLQLLAMRQGFELYIDVDPSSGRLTGRFGPLQLEDEPQGLLTIHMGQSSNLNYLNVRYDMLRPTEVRVDNIDAESGEDQSGSASESDVTLLGGDGLFAATTPRVSRLLPAGANIEAELNRLAKGLTNRSSFAVIAEGEVDTNNFGLVLRAKRTVSVRGAGRVYSGVYLVERVHHAFVEGQYSQSFTLRRNALSPRRQDDFTPEERGS
jgi:phage protein D